MAAEDKLPFLCVITPVFDPAYESLVLLTGELKEQSNPDFIHVMISNGPSPRVKQLIDQLREVDRRFIYDELPQEDQEGAVKLLINLGRRREYCLKHYEAQRYVFLDADIKLVDRDYFARLQKAHQEIQRDILITLVEINDAGRSLILPLFPIKLGHIDMGNFTFSRSIARNFSYPTDQDEKFGAANDYRFYSRIANPENTAILNFMSAIRDGNNRYRRLSVVFNEEFTRPTPPPPPPPQIKLGLRKRVKSWIRYIFRD
jgi:hypothetical protein